MKCPKCGSENVDWAQTISYSAMERTQHHNPIVWVCNDCGENGECGHEEKVGGPPSCCGQEMLALSASKSEWKCLACGSKIGGEKR